MPAQGPREIQGLAHAFNDMTGALERRRGALEKAVSDLRGVNADLRHARDGLDRAERLASVGRLAAGVAHEVGNPIAAMMAFLDLVGRDDGISATSKQHLGRASREGERVGRILRVPPAACLRRSTSRAPPRRPWGSCERSSATRP